VKTLKARSVRRPQRGVSLMELLVGMAIGFMVILAALGAMLVTQQTSGAVADRSRLQQRADDVLRNMGSHIQHSGALTLVASGVSTNSVGFSQAYPGIDTSRTTGIPNLHVFGTEGQSGGADSLVVGYQDDSDTGADNTRDCLGNPAPTAARGLRMDNTFRVTSGSDLECVGSGGLADVLAEGVEDFQVRYAVKTGNWAARQTRWFNAAELTSAGLWPQVQAVEVCLLLRGERTDNHRPTVDTLDCNLRAVPKDGRLRLLSRKTFVLRNAVLERE
jgi:type IV pilus assembly protein PilW